MVTLISRRLAVTLPVVVLVTVVSFILVKLTPGDPARYAAGESAPPEQIEMIRTSLGLDRPLWEQYLLFLRNAATFDFGTSIQDARPVGDILGDALGITFSLALVAFVLAMVLGISAGALAALKKGRWPDRAVTLVASLGLAVPPFVLALVFVVPLALQRDWFPATGYVDFTDSPGGWLLHLLLPGLTLALVSAAEIARQVRGALIDTLEQDFVRTARAAGIAEWLVIGKRASRSAAPPVLTVLGLQVPRVIGGAILVETVFAIPGLGSLSVNAVITHDLPVVQAVVLVTALFVVVTNLLVDVSNGVVNPKLRV